MLPRRACLWVLMLSLGCQSLPTPKPLRVRAHAEDLWVEGRTAMQEGRPDDAIRLYEQSLASDPDRPQTYLSLAAARMEKGDEAGACPLLARYVAARPYDVKVRAYYAELLARLHQTDAARAEFARCDADAQEQVRPPMKQMIHCQTRLAKLAAAADDEYDEHLHRGIGLYLLSQERAALPDPDGELSAEGMLCRSAAELTQAGRLRPEEARPRWYLYEVWSHLGQRQPAQRCLHAAADAAPFTELTTAEKRDLRLAAQHE